MLVWWCIQSICKQLQSFSYVHAASSESFSLSQNFDCYCLYLYQCMHTQIHSRNQIDLLGDAHGTALDSEIAQGEIKKKSWN